MTLDPKSQNALADAAEQARAKLFDDLYFGRIEPDEAEDLAEQQGVGPLKPRPSPSVYEANDPNHLARWSICMAVSWIAWRDLDRVREACDAFRRECYSWQRHRWQESNGVRARAARRKGEGVESGEGWKLEKLGDATIEGLLDVELDPDAKPKYHSVTDAKDRLWSAAVEGRIIADGIKAVDGTPVDIPCSEWRFLVTREHLPFDVAGNCSRPVDLAIPAGPLDRIYCEVGFSRGRLLELWPADCAAPTSNPIVEDGSRILDILSSARWPIQCVVAWRYAQLAGMTDDARDNLVRATWREGPFVIGGLDDETFERRQLACRDVLDQAVKDPANFALRGQDGQPVGFGAAAELIWNETTFELYFDRKRNVDDCVDGLWCSAAELRAAWPQQSNAPEPTGSVASDGNDHEITAMHWQDRSYYPALEALIRDGKAKSPHGAAKLLSTSTKPLPGLESDNQADRHARHYRRDHPNWKVKLFKHAK